MKISDDRLNYHIANVEECAEVDGIDDLYEITVGEMSQLLETLVGLHSSIVYMKQGTMPTAWADCPGCPMLDEQKMAVDMLLKENNLLPALLDLPTTVHKAPNVTPDDMVRYLEANGYIKHGENIKSNGHENAFAYYIHKDDTEAEGVWVPLRNEFNDWKGRCIDAMRAMASSMDKTQLRVWYELTMMAKKDEPE